MTVQDLNDKQLDDAIIRAQQYLLNAPQIQQELQAMLQEKQKRSEKVEKEEKKK